MAHVQAEAERIRQGTARGIEKIQARAEQEVAAAAKTARQELKRYTADLAVQLAAGQIHDRLDPAGQKRLIEGFVQQLRSQKANN